MDGRPFDARRRALMSTETASSRVRDAARSARPLRIVAGGTWLGAGGVVKAADTFSLADDRGIVEYVPGDLTLTARAGTSIAELVTAVKANDQWLPLDPWGGDAGTLGATLSTATAGPHSHAMGLPRDVALGLEFVSGTGEAIRAGGRVVKNVAGFDLTRLIIGAWGSLGVITEATLRLRARPAVLRSFLLTVDTEVDALSRLASNLRSMPFTPVASELVNAALARRLGVGRDATMILRIAGNTNSVKAQTAALQQLGRLSDAPADVWRRLRESDHDAHATWRRSHLPSAFGGTWNGVERGLKRLDEPLMHGNPMRGVVRVIASGPIDIVQQSVTAGEGTLAIEMLPNGSAPRESPERQKTASLERRIRDAFDPRRILNPGIMGIVA
jgi:glycolate oxidase FAD binding subunit